MKTDQTKESSLESFPYLTQADRDRIMDGFKVLGITKQQKYTNAYEFSKNMDQVSLLRSEGIQYSLTSSSI
jgi:hypothetical protein